jgi:hypothetical protein
MSDPRPEKPDVELVEVTLCAYGDGTWRLIEIPVEHPILIVDRRHIATKTERKPDAD